MNESDFTIVVGCQPFRLQYCQEKEEEEEEKEEEEAEEKDEEEEEALDDPPKNMTTIIARSNWRLGDSQEAQLGYLIQQTTDDRQHLHIQVRLWPANQNVTR